MELNIDFTKTPKFGFKLVSLRISTYIVVATAPLGNNTPGEAHGVSYIDYLKS